MHHLNDLLAIIAILGSDGNAQVLTEPNGISANGRGKCKRPLAQHVVGPSVLTIPRA